MGGGEALTAGPCTVVAAVSDADGADVGGGCDCCCK